MERIKEQLEEYCNCVEFDDKDVQEMLSIVSMATCWSESVDRCPSFLQGDRREVIDLPNCMDCVYDFVPTYRPFVKESFAFSLIRIDGIEETATPIVNYKYSEIDGKFRIDLGLPSCKCTCDPCGCPPKYRLLVTYVAGYEEIPECLLPAFCNLLDVIHAKNKCDCNSCACDTEEGIQYAQGDAVTVQVETNFGQMISEIITQMIGYMSVCKAESDIWGVIE